MRNDRWLDVARGTGLLDATGAVSSTIFAEMTALATRTGAVNLGQGFPDVDGPEHLKDAAVAAIREGHNQYPPLPGVPALREAVATHQDRHYGLKVDPDREVLVTAGATEAIAASILALAGPGDEVLTLEPYYDAYAACIAMAGASHRTVPLRPGVDGFHLDLAELRAAFTGRTRLVVVNSPHNPTGTVLDVETLTLLAELAAAHDAIIITDEVYEHLTYDAVQHVPIATLPAADGRTLTISSAGKTLSFTGWRVGWLHGPAELVTAVRTVKQFLSYVPPAPFQHAVAAALADVDGLTGRHIANLRATLQARRDLLLDALESAGFAAVRPAGTYFVVADAAPLGFDDAAKLCRTLPERVGVVGVPVSAFCRTGSPTGQALGSWLRLTFVKSDDVLHRAAAALATLR